MAIMSGPCRDRSPHKTKRARPGAGRVRADRRWLERAARRRKCKPGFLRSFQRRVEARRSSTISDGFDRAGSRTLTVGDRLTGKEYRATERLDLTNQGRGTGGSTPAGKAKQQLVIVTPAQASSRRASARQIAGGAVDSQRNLACFGQSARRRAGRPSKRPASRWQAAPARSLPHPCHRPAIGSASASCRRAASTRASPRQPTSSAHTHARASLRSATAPGGEVARPIAVSREPGAVPRPVSPPSNGTP